jgi:hypothetical protein
MKEYSPAHEYVAASSGCDCKLISQIAHQSSIVFE